MSRIGNRILKIPEGVEFTCQANNVVMAKGPKGTLTKSLPEIIKIMIENETISTKRPNEQKHSKQLHGTVNSLIEGMLVGVKSGFQKILLISGVGYRANLKENKIVLSLGFSHPVEYIIPENIKVECPTQTEIRISGIDKQLVGEVAAKIRAFRKPEPYKGKGIKYNDEHIIRKEGKSAGK